MKVSEQIGPSTVAEQLESLANRLRRGEVQLAEFSRMCEPYKSGTIRTLHLEYFDGPAKKKRRK